MLGQPTKGQVAVLKLTYQVHFTTALTMRKKEKEEREREIGQVTRSSPAKSSGGEKRKRHRVSGYSFNQSTPFTSFFHQG